MPYQPLEDFQTLDADRSSRRIRNMPYGKQQHSLSVFPASLAFVLETPAEDTASQTILLVNQGYDVLPIIGITVAGPFELDGTAPTEVGAGEIVSIQIKPQTTAIPASTGGVFIDTGNAAGQEFVNLYGSSDGGVTVINWNHFFIRATNVGLGTADAIEATTEDPIPEGDAQVLIALNILADNTTTTPTVSFNGDTPLTMVDNTGEPILAGTLGAGSIVVGFKYENTFRILNENDTSITIGGLYQPLDADLTAIAALTTQVYGRSLLTLTSAAELADQITPELEIDVDLSGYQPLDSDLTAIAALTTTAYGRNFLTLTDSSDLETALGIDYATVAEVRSAATGNKIVTADLVEGASAFVAISDNLNLSFDWDAGLNRSLTLIGNRTLNNPTNGQAGTWRTIILTQDEIGSRLLTWGDQYKFPGGTEPVLSSTGGSVDVLSILCVSSTNFYVFTAKDLKA